MSSQIVPFNLTATMPAEISALFSDGNGVQAFANINGYAQTSRISIRSAKFRMEVGSQEIEATHNPIDVVILRSSPSVLRQYWGREYKVGDTQPPMCYSNSSLDSEKPNTNSMQPQASSCRECPHNIKGSGRTGTSKACASRVKIALVTAGNIQSSNVYEMDIPPASLWGDAEHEGSPNARYSYNSYAKFLSSKGLDTRQLVTRITMDEVSSTPKIWFAPIGHIQDIETAQYIATKSNTKEAIDAVIYNYRKPETTNAPSYAPLANNVELPFVQPVSAPVSSAFGASVVMAAPAPVEAPIAPAVIPEPTPVPVAAVVAPVVKVAPTPAPVVVAPIVDNSALANLLDDWDSDDI